MCVCLPFRISSSFRKKAFFHGWIYGESFFLNLYDQRTYFIYGCIESSQAGNQAGRLEERFQTTIRKKTTTEIESVMKLWTSTIHTIHTIQICFCYTPRLSSSIQAQSECWFSHSVECQSTLSFSHFYFHQLVSRKNCPGRMRSLERTRGEKPPFFGWWKWAFPW